MSRFSEEIALTEIELSGKKYPICMDLNILADLQEKYGSIAEFEHRLRGLVRAKDGKGWVEGKEPSAKVIAYVLPLMINEALEIQADEDQDYPVKRVSKIRIINEVDKSPRELARIITEELAYAMAVKKKTVTNISSRKRKKTT